MTGKATLQHASVALDGDEDACAIAAHYLVNTAEGQTDFCRIKLFFDERDVVASPCGLRPCYSH